MGFWYLLNTVRVKSLEAKWPNRPKRLIFGFHSMKRLGVFLLPLDGMLVHCRATPSIKFAGTHLYTWMERGRVWVKCQLPKNTTQCPQPGLEPGPLAPESSTLTIRPPLLPHDPIILQVNALFKTVRGARSGTSSLGFWQRGFFKNNLELFSKFPRNQTPNKLKCETGFTLSSHRSALWDQVDLEKESLQLERKLSSIGNTDSVIKKRSERWNWDEILPCSPLR